MKAENEESGAFLVDLWKNARARQLPSNKQNLTGAVKINVASIYNRNYLFVFFSKWRVGSHLTATGTILETVKCLSLWGISHLPKKISPPLLETTLLFFFFPSCKTKVKFKPFTSVLTNQFTSTSSQMSKKITLFTHLKKHNTWKHL